MYQICGPIVVMHLFVLILSQLHSLIEILKTFFPFYSALVEYCFIVSILMMPLSVEALELGLLVLLFYSSSRPHLYSYYFNQNATEGQHPKITKYMKISVLCILLSIGW